MSQRYLPNDPQALLKEPDPHHQLLLCLSSLLKNYPPLANYSKHESHGLYSGPTSIAYLFLQLSHLQPHLITAGHHANSWCKAYLSPSRQAHGVTPDNCGVINEVLASCAVNAALTGDEAAIRELTDHASAIAEEPHGSDEWLYGRAGFLYLLRLVRHWVPSSNVAMASCIKKLGDRILHNGPRWRWHGKEYLGAVHGSVGIVTQLILSDPEYATHPKVVSTLEELLEMQDSSGNFPSSVDSGKDHLVQFCHGAPGVALSLPLIRRHFRTSTQKQAIDLAVEKATACIWQKGLLTKEPNLCHGASANALALASPQREHFMTYTTADMVARGKTEGWYLEGSDPYGLFCGEAGRAWAWAVLDAGKELGVIGYSDL